MMWLGLNIVEILQTQFLLSALLALKELKKNYAYMSVRKGSLALNQAKIHALLNTPNYRETGTERKIKQIIYILF